MHVLIVSATASAPQNFVDAVRASGHVIEVTPHPATAIDRALGKGSDLLVVQDDHDFRASAFVRNARNAGYGDSVLLIDDQDSPTSRVAAFDAGADQVVSARAQPAEWQARVRSLLRNCKAHPADRLRCGELTLDLKTLALKRGGKPLRLVGKPLALLEFFLRYPDTIHDRDRIARSVWERDFDPFSNVIEVTVSKVRAVIDRGFDPPYLHTVPGRGYFLGVKPPGA